MKRIFKAYRDLIGIIFRESPWLVALTLGCTVLSGLLVPAGIYVNTNVLDGGLAVARGQMAFGDYWIFLVLFVIAAILPEILDQIVYVYVEPRSLLILRTAYRARMLRKLKTMKYEHFEAEASAEIIDKAYNRVESAARHLWPMYVYARFAGLIAGVGTLIYVFRIRWWLLLTVLLPFLLETYVSARNNFNIYNELETYWKKERKYGILGNYLRSRNYTKELKAYGNADYLIDVYKTRLGERNRDYERYSDRDAGTVQRPNLSGWTEYRKDRFCIPLRFPGLRLPGTGPLPQLHHRRQRILRRCEQKKGRRAD